MSHLGDAASALVDGELAGLDPHTRERTLFHVATCHNCQADVEAQRLLKMRLRLGAGTPAVPDGLLHALLSIADADAYAGAAADAALLAATSIPGAASRRPPWRVVSAAPRGRTDAGGPGRGVRTTGRSRPRYMAAAGLAASVVVGLGGGGALTGAASVATGTAGTAGTAGAAATSPSLASASSSSSTSSTLVTAGVISSTMAADTRPVVRPHARAALSVVYRRP
jgi:hypothetical protein